MLQAVLVWAGAVLAIGLLLVMALGPVIVELDTWWYERRHNRKARTGTQRKAAAKTDAKPDARADAKVVAKIEAPVAQRVAHPVA